MQVLSQLAPFYVVFHVAKFMESISGFIRHGLQDQDKLINILIFLSIHIVKETSSLYYDKIILLSICFEGRISTS